MSFKIPVAYTSKQVADAKSFSPSARKPEPVVADWLHYNGENIQIITPNPAMRDQLSAAHDPDYVRDVLTCQRENGFGNKLKSVAEALPYVVGSHLTACKEAVANRKVAVSPTSGFHHAGKAHAEGFCTFNGLAVSALCMLEAHAVRRIAILDLDAHYGNGTEEILSAEIAYNDVMHFTRGNVDYPEQGAKLDRLLFGIDSFIERASAFGVGLLMYQAGADPHINDPLGGTFTTEELMLRDRRVFQRAHAAGIPVVWNLAGGYQRVTGKPFPASIEPVLEIHRNTMKECVAEYCT